MKAIIISLFSVLFLLACQQATEVGDADLKTGNPVVKSGTKVFTFAGDTAYTLVFVDSVTRMASIHSLNPALVTYKPTEVINLSAVEDSTDVEKLRILFESKSHHIYIVALGDRAMGDICCNTLMQSDVLFKGTGHLEYAYFGWGEVEEESEEVFVPKVMSDEYNIKGVGQVKNLENGDVISYEARCCVMLNLVDVEEIQRGTTIRFPDL